VRSRHERLRTQASPEFEKASATGAGCGNAALLLALELLAWDMLPDGFPPFSTVYRWFARFRDDGTWETINHHLVMRDRERVGRAASPTAAVLDSQSAKRPPRPAALADTMSARRSKGANATRWWTRKGVPSRGPRSSSTRATPLAPLLVKGALSTHINSAA
jgi:transposase